MECGAHIAGTIVRQCFACLSDENIVEPLPGTPAFLDLFRTTFNFEIELKPNYPDCVCNCCLEKLQGAADFLTQVQSCLRCLELELSKTAEQVNVEQEEEKPPSPSWVRSEDGNVDDSCVASSKGSHSDSESDNEPLIKWVGKKKKKLKKVALRLVQEAIKQYKDKCKENSNCVLCEFKGLNVRNLSCHMLFKHKEEKNQWCLRCNLMVEDLENHKKSHANRIWCTFCEKGITRCHYVEHLKYHAGPENYKKFVPESLTFRPDRDQRYQCHICQKTFKLFKSLKDHVSTHGRYKCEVCEKNFEIPELLASHWCSGKAAKNHFAQQVAGENTHRLPLEAEEEKLKEEPHEQDYASVITNEEAVTKLKPVLQVESLTCHFCQRTYKTAYKLQKHIEAHMGIFLAKCKYCDKGFSSKADLINHERVHTKEKPFICSTCGKGFVSGATLRIHMKQHTGKPEECELCQKRFCRKSELKLHLQKHRGERPFLCTDCGKSFAQKSHLTCHLTMHSEERPYPCSLCGKSFKKKELLKHHMNLHGDKKFKCDVCLYECHKKYRLQQHKKMHEEKPGVKVLHPCPLCNRSFSSLHLLNIHMGNAHNVIIAS